MNKLKKGFYITVGLICVILGSIGVIIPILPTTPFLLLASFCFVRGSDRFDRWFKGTKLYKKHLESFTTNRSMTLKAKISILLFADIMMAFPLIIIDNLVVKVVLILVILFKFYYFIFRIKTIKEKPING
ncbi:YbaN family protein [Clostridium chauvoei]|uniref:YbaN family protein n=1 Tax=Clostridium chauvoei TaxID=46867 RepID=UPI001C8620A7|nr:YbaN family protein [Clostridium chauvoei]MBX7355712.1 YbaN family protein [Clostridium chauvoei]